MTAGEAAVGTAGISRVKANNWDRWYAGEPAPWEIDRPQPVLVQLAVDGRLSGRVLDVGCGSGEHALLAAEHGAEALGIDISPTAIKRASRRPDGVGQALDSRSAMPFASIGSARSSTSPSTAECSRHSMPTSVRCMRPAWRMSSVPVASSM